MEKIIFATFQKWFEDEFKLTKETSDLWVKKILKF